MEIPRKAIVLIVGFALALGVPLTFSTPAAASTVTINLWGSRAGWGSNETNAASPGPNLTAAVGDTVVLTVNTTDSRIHTWYLDYSNDSFWNETTAPWEPGTTFWNATTHLAVTITFIVNFTAGTYKYRSLTNPDAAMVGTFTVTPATGLFGGAGDNTVVIVVGVVIVIIAVLAIAAMYWRRMGKPPAAPPPPTR